MKKNIIIIILLILCIVFLSLYIYQVTKPKQTTQQTTQQLTQQTTQQLTQQITDYSSWNINDAENVLLLLNAYIWSYYNTNVASVPAISFCLLSKVIQSGVTVRQFVEPDNPQANTILNFITANSDCLYGLTAPTTNSNYNTWPNYVYGPAVFHVFDIIPQIYTNKHGCGATLNPRQYIYANAAAVIDNIRPTMLSAYFIHNFGPATWATALNRSILINKIFNLLQSNNISLPCNIYPPPPQ